MFTGRLSLFQHENAKRHEATGNSIDGEGGRRKVGNMGDGRWGVWATEGGRSVIRE
jgi:hypothetical protein